MNRTNSGANTDTEQILLDVFLLACSFGITKLIFGWDINGKALLSLGVLMAVFTLLYILSNKEEYLYNVTLFWYLDRIHRKISKSFLIGTIATSAVMYCVLNVGKAERKFYFIFLIISYMLLCTKIFVYRKLSFRLRQKTVPRTVFVGKAGSFNKFTYFLDKTNIQMNVVWYVAMTSMEVATDQRYIGCLRELEELIRTYKIDQVYIIQKHGDELPFTHNT